jgi:hypothetical protein
LAKQFPKLVLCIGNTGADNVCNVKLSGSQVSMVMQFLPFFVSTWLRVEHIKESKLEYLLERYDNGAACVFALCKALLCQALCNTLVFAESRKRGKTHLDTVRSWICKARDASIAVFHLLGNYTMKKPNWHNPQHHPEALDEYATGPNLSTARNETFHGVHRQTTNHSNHRHPELDMMEAHNFKQAIYFLMAGGHGSKFDVKFTKWIKKSPVLAKIMKHANSTSTYAGKAADEFNPDGGMTLRPGKTTGTTDVDVLEMRESYLKYTGMNVHEFPTTASLLSQVVIPDREKFASRILPSGFFRVLTKSGKFKMVKVIECLQHVVNDSYYIWAKVQNCVKQSESQHGFSVYNISELTQYVPVIALVRPVHCVTLDSRTVTHNDCFLK